MSRPHVLPRDHLGLPIVTRVERRLSIAIAAAATLWFALVACWELFGPILAGHYAASASLGIAADNMLRWGIVGPVWEYTASEPTPGQYYSHHPWGIFWTTTVLMKFLGRHDYVCRLPAVLASVATVPLLFLMGRALWRPAAGALAAGAFVVLPITLAFASFNALEVPVIAWSTLGLWATVRFRQTWKRRYLVLSLVGFFLALHADWPAFVLVGALLCFDLVFGLVWSRPFGREAPAAFAKHWALLASITVVVALFYAALFHRAGTLSDLLASYRFRSRGSGQSLSSVLASRHYWIELMFTPVAVWLGKLGAVVCAIRLVWLRERSEVVPLVVLAMAVLQYLLFKQGADVHIYWPHYFAQFFALAFGAICATAIGSIEGAGRNRGHPVAGVLTTAAAALIALAVIARDGITILPYARASGGRFNEKGLLIDSEGDKIATLRWLSNDLPRAATVGLHASMKPNWAQVWSLGGRLVRVGVALPLSRTEPRSFAADVVVADARFMTAGEQTQLAECNHVLAAGPFWIVRAGAPWAPLDAMAIDEREPSPLEWYFISGTEPVRALRADPHRTWELRTHFGQLDELSSELPDVSGASLEDRRIAHNEALVRGDAANAESISRELGGVVSEPRSMLADHAELLGVRYQKGAQPTLTMLFRARGPLQDGTEISLVSSVVARAHWSTTMTDPTVRDVGLPPDLSRRQWRAGHLYAWRVPICKRPGRERFELRWRTTSPGVRGGPSRSGAMVVLELED